MLQEEPKLSTKFQPQASRVRTETANQHVPCQRLLGSTRWSAPSSLVRISQPEEDPCEFPHNMRLFDHVGCCATALACPSRLRDVFVLLKTLEEMMSEEAWFCRDAWDCPSNTLRPDIFSPCLFPLTPSTNPPSPNESSLRNGDGVKALDSKAS
jgi:hypothetical protein